MKDKDKCTDFWDKWFIPILVIVVVILFTLLLDYLPIPEQFKNPRLF